MNEIRQISDRLYSLTCHLIGTTTHQVRLLYTLQNAENANNLHCLKVVV